MDRSAAFGLQVWDKCGTKWHLFQTVIFTYACELVPGAGIEPARGRAPRDFKSLASTCSATQAVEEGEVFDCNSGENY
jgi:hypothetical protein